ncbi:uncharacterized protein LOC111027615 [Myzus persicae]|uniref:uncharacterized protein LOC111027615 n=1 Tax=Myzus persicae TaxID=13164 RepID=UPI000B9346AF|nr:uncharacterized protein LOC111027615 [Myzus persicae]
MAQQKNADGPKLKAKEIIKIISEESGVGQRTVSVTLSEYRNKGSVSSPNKTKVRPTVTEKVDDFDQDAIRKKVHEFWHRREIPTLKKILTAVNKDTTLPNFSETSLRRLLKHLNFEYVRKSRNSALIERIDIVCWRRRYLQAIKEYRQLGRPIYYLDETWVNAGETTSKTWVDKTVNSPRDAFVRGLTTGQKEPSGKGKRLIVVHIGSSDGFVVGGLLCFESKKNTGNYHDEMNGDTFYDWFANILPLLRENAVIVMDNASYHSVNKHTFPVRSWKKQDIIDWLTDKGEVTDQTMVKEQLLERVQILKPQFNEYVIDELAKSADKTVLRLPPYHCELNPIELAWASVKNYVKMNNSTFKMNDVKKLLEEGVERVTPDMWKNFVDHIIKVEEKFWQVDFISNELLDAEVTSHVLTITGDTSDSFSDSNSIND